MIQEDYVSFEIAKLLKEKGFNEECFALYNPDGVLIQSGIRLNNIQVGRVKGSYSAPTLQMAMKWLREVYNIQIQISPITSRHKDWTFGIYRDFNPLTIDLLCFPTYEEATEAAIKYALENLI